MNELISEGNIGLMQAVKKFDPDKDFDLQHMQCGGLKLYTRICFKILEFGKNGYYNSSKKLFNQKKKNQIAPGQEGDLKDEQVEEISKRLDVDGKEVINMNRRMMGQEKSLNVNKKGESDEWQDWLVDDSLDQELIISQKQEYNDKKIY